MAWDHHAKQKQMALEAINRPRPYRPVKVVPHDPNRDPAFVKEISGWFGTEIYIMGKTPEEMETTLGFEPGYLAHGIAVFEFLRPIAAADFDVGGAYTHLPGGKEWDGADLKWPPGTGVPQWKLKVKVPCKLIKTVPRGIAYS